MSAALLLSVCGYGAARLAGLSSLWVAVPLAAGAAVYLLDGLSGRAKGVLVFVLLALDGYWIVRDMSGINFLFAVLLFAGSLTLTIACLYRGDERPGFYPLLAVLLLSLSGLPHASTSLEFFFLFELVTLSSYFLIARRREAVADAFSYLIFSLAAGYFLLAGFAHGPRRDGKRGARRVADVRPGQRCWCLACLPSASSSRREPSACMFGCRALTPRLKTMCRRCCRRL